MPEAKHAFLIMVHSNVQQVKKLLQMIDNYNNDIFLHIDKKVFLANDSEFESCVKFSKLTIMREVKVNWGAYSQIKCEILLLKKASETYHQYYHLISGMDVVLPEWDSFFTFFNTYKDREFIHFQSKNISESTYNHIRYYYMFQEYANMSKHKHLSRIIRGIQRFTVLVQKLLHVDRWDKNIKLQKGANWFSITHSLAQYVLKKYPSIIKQFKWSLNGDELFLQTIVYNSDFRVKLFSPSFDDDYWQCARYVDWTRGKPYLFTKKDSSELSKSNGMFARKCSLEITDFFLKLKQK